MQIRFLSAVFFLMFLFCGCTEQKSQTSQQTKKDSTEEHTFFPVTEYIRGQLSEIDSLPITPLKIINYNGKQDSIWMKKENIRVFAEPFLHPEIDTTNFKYLFIEKSFLDQTINAFTFSYDPVDKLPDSLQLKRWDVYIDPKKNTIKRIYIVKEVNNNGTLQTVQLTWKSNQWCKITTITEQAGKQPDIKEELMKWDFSE
jgi:hypothetical protein